MAQRFDLFLDLIIDLISLLQEAADLADQILQDPKGGVKAASLSMLIELMLSSGDGVFGKVVLATYQSFTKAETFLARLVQRYQVRSTFFV